MKVLYKVERAPFTPVVVITHLSKEEVAKVLEQMVKKGVESGR